MIYYVDESGQVFAYDSAEAAAPYLTEGMREISKDEADALSVPAPTPAEIAVQKIETLEASITARRLREAVLSDAGKAWLTDIEMQIQVLRAPAEAGTNAVGAGGGQTRPT